MAEFRYAYLYKNGEQTSCMVAVVSMTFGIVAANCIDLTNDNKVDTSVKYKIHYSPYNNNTGPMYDISPSGFTVHPNFNPQTLENNIAVLQYTDSTADSYSSYISTNAIGPTNKVYIRRDYDILTSTWTAPELINNDVSDSDCEDTSPMYAANTDYMTCISSTTTSIISSKCSIPYALMYKEKSDDVIALSTIYSHSVIFGDDMCGGSNRILNYYTYLSGGLSKGEKIAIGVTVPLGVILVAIGVIIVFHIWKINRQDKAWDPQAETMNLHDIAIEIRADDVNIGPPPYAHVNKSDELIVFHSDTTTDSKK
ncbi:hypothetical protein GGI11_000047 [Coemansia sp. RSA 2049]|nr:hypothetical protein GGI11_000047 [Coemansia sp. RSA 2049]